jgi:hypothetical protein
MPPKKKAPASSDTVVDREDNQPSKGEVGDLCQPWLQFKDEVDVPICILRLLNGTDTLSRAPDNEHVQTHKETWENGAFDRTTSMFYAVATTEIWSPTELGKVHPHAEYFTDEWVKTDAGKSLGLCKLNVLDGQHRLIGWELATREIRFTLEQSAAGGEMSTTWMPSVQVRVLRANTPTEILVSKIGAVCVFLQTYLHIVCVCIMIALFNLFLFCRVSILYVKP